MKQKNDRNKFQTNAFAMEPIQSYENNAWCRTVGEQQQEQKKYVCHLIEKKKKNKQNFYGSITALHFQYGSQTKLQQLGSPMFFPWCLTAAA